MQRSKSKKVPSTQRKSSTGAQKRFNRSRGKKCDDTEIQSNARTNSDNDFPWYNRIPALTSDATKLQYSWPTGRPINIGSADNPWYWTAPGLMVEYLVPTYGFTSVNTDPINVMAQQMYAYLRKDQTSSAVFDRQDAAIYEFAVAEMFSYIEFLRRAYGIATRVSVDNAYIPNILLQAMGISATDVVNHLGDFRYGINVLIQKASQFAVPSEMTLFARRVFLYSGIYTEGSSIKDQMYMYSPAGFYKYSNDPDTKAGILKYTEFLNPTNGVPSVKTVNDLLIYGTALVNALMDAGDVSFVSGAIVKTFGSNLITLNLLPEDYFVSPVFDITVLEQMKNATVIPYAGYNKPDLEQNVATNTLQFEPTFSVDMWTSGTTPAYQQVKSQAMRVLQFKKILQTTTAEVNPAVTMENSRLMIACVLDDPMTTSEVNLYCATELCVQAVIYSLSTKATPTSGAWLVRPIAHIMPQWIQDNNTYNTSSDSWSSVSVSTKLEAMQSFDFTPPVWLLTTYTSSDEQTVTTSGYKYYLHDADNFTVLDDHDLRRLHEAAMISMLTMSLYNNL